MDVTSKDEEEGIVESLNLNTMARTVGRENP